MAVTWRKLTFQSDALGTPTSGVLTNCTGLPVGGLATTGTPDGTKFLRDDAVWAAAGGGVSAGELAKIIVGTTIVGFNMSVSGGTAEQPAIIYQKKSTEWIKAAITWGTTGGEDGNPTVIVYSYSSNSGGAYDTLGTVTIAYDSSGNVTTTTWT